MKSFKHACKLIMPAALLTFAGQAMAIPTLVVSSGTDIVSVSDADGSVFYAGSVGGFTTTFEAGLTKPELGSAGDAQLDLVGLQNGSGTLDVWFGDTGYTESPLVGAFSTALNSLASATADFELCYATSDLLAGLTDITAKLSCSALGGTSIALPTKHTGQTPGTVDISSIAFPTAPDYFLAIHAKITHTANGNSSFEARLVPEPSSIAAWGIGLLGLTFARRRKLGKA